MKIDTCNVAQVIKYCVSTFIVMLEAIGNHKQSSFYYFGIIVIDCVFFVCTCPYSCCRFYFYVIFTSPEVEVGELPPICESELSSMKAVE